MTKRVSLRDRRESDMKGVDAIFDSGAAPLNGSNGVGDAAEKSTLAKVTVYVRPEQVVAVESIQLSERKRTGKRRDKSDLYQEALELLIERYGLE